MVRPLDADPIIRVGLLGAGRMGGPIGRHLLAAGTPVTVFDPSEPARRALVEAGADVEALRLGRALGVEPSRLRGAMAIGSGANRPLAEWGRHRLRWPHKDLEVALAVAGEAGVEMPLVEQLPALMRELTVDDLHELL